MKKDSTRASLENFSEVSWSLKEDYAKPVQIKINIEDNGDNVVHKALTFDFIKKVVLCLIIVCHSSCRNCQEFIRIIFDYSISVDSISSIINKAGERAREFNKTINLSHIKDIALDEIFSKRIPILVGICLKSFYIFMLEKADGRSGLDWGLALLEKKEEQSLDPVISVMD